MSLSAEGCTAGAQYAPPWTTSKQHAPTGLLTTNLARGEAQASLEKELALSSGWKRHAASGTGTIIWSATTESPVHTLMHALAAVRPTTESTC